MNDITLFVGKSLAPADFARWSWTSSTYCTTRVRVTVGMCLALHPFIINQPFRHKYLDKALEYIAGHDRCGWRQRTRLPTGIRHSYDAQAASGCPLRTTHHSESLG